MPEFSIHPLAKQVVHAMICWPDVLASPALNAETERVLMAEEFLTVTL